MNEEWNFRDEANAMEWFPNFSGKMTYLGPYECDVDLEWTVRLNQVYAHCLVDTYMGEMDEIIVRERKNCDTSASWLWSQESPQRGGGLLKGTGF